jgi:hypothetical protein
MNRLKEAATPAAALLVTALLAAPAADTAVRAPQRAATAGTTSLVVFGGRSAAQRHDGSAAKLDATLADLATHAGKLRPGHEIEDLHALNPAARFVKSASGEPLVLVDAVTRGNPARLRDALVRLGLQRPAVFANDVGGWLPVAALGSATARTELLAMRAALMRSRAANIVATQGDFAQGSSALRSAYPGLNGAGVTVGILSDSFNCYGVYDQPGSGVPASGQQGYAPNGFASTDASVDETSGALTAKVNVLEEASCLQYGAPTLLPDADEGRAMLQIVHAVAPGASLAFYTADNSEADFASGILALAAQGAKVIADDTGYFDEPFYQDGIVAQSVDIVESEGVA